MVVFLDGDYSDYPEEMALLVDPIIDRAADIAAGSRILGYREEGALSPQARFGNWLACGLIRLFWGASYSDLGPFRAVRASALNRLSMRDKTYGWVVEMQIKATRAGLRVLEVPISYRLRIGKSKITGTFTGVLKAGVKILFTVFVLAIGSFYQGRIRRAGDRLIIFTRYPEPGKTKTRLIPALGPEEAARLQRKLAESTFAVVNQVKKQRRISVEVHYTGGNEEMMRQWLGPAAILKQQGKGNLGARIARAFCEAFQSRMKRVLIIGTDCPGLTVEILLQALDALKSNDMVVGPAKDGGYYLIGLRFEIPDLFKDIPWGTANVLESTLERAYRVGINPVLLETLEDVDRPEDLHLLQQRQWRTA